MSNNNKLYKYIYSNIGEVDTVITSGSSAVRTFEINPCITNFSEFNLKFLCTWTVNGKFPHIYADNIAVLKRLKLYTKEGIVLCNIDDVARFTKVCMKPNLKQADLNTFSTDGFNDAGNFQGIRKDNGSFIYRYNGTNLNNFYFKNLSNNNT